MRKETDTICRKKTGAGRSECRGALSIKPQSRLEDSLGHRSYMCDKCGDQFKFTGKPDV